MTIYNHSKAHIYTTAEEKPLNSQHGQVIDFIDEHMYYKFQTKLKLTSRPDLQ